MHDKIKEMYGFLWACRMTGYLLPEQIALLTMGIEFLDNSLQFADGDQIHGLTEILERKTAELKGVGACK